MKAIETLQSLKNAFDGIPPAYLDRQMVQKLARAKVVARGCARNVSDAGYKKQASELEERFAMELNRGRLGQSEAAEDVHGQVVKWFPDKGFGFISVPNGTQYFFHLSSVISPSDINAVRIGTRVIFNPEKSAKGFRAANIEFLDLIQ